MKLTFDNIHPKDACKQVAYLMEKAIDAARKTHNSTLIVRECPICKYAHIEFIAEVYGCHVFRCCFCGLFFLNPYPDEEQLAIWHNSEVKRLENEVFKKSIGRRVDIFVPRVELIRNIKASGDLLDVGFTPNVMAFSEVLSRHDGQYQLTCCNSNDHTRGELKKRYPHVRVINLEFMDINEKVESNRFDIISFWDTLELIVDLNATFRKTRKLLKDSGILVFSTPNTNSFEWIIGLMNHLALAPLSRHVNLLNEKAIRILLSNNGFEMLDAQTMNPSLDISYVKNLIENREVNISRLGLFLKEELYNPDFETLLEEYLIRNNKAGNILVTARKLVGSQVR